MKSVTVILPEGANPSTTARDIAIKEGFNCYSKPSGPDSPKDFVTAAEAVYYFSWNGKKLEVIINLTGTDPLEPVEEAAHSEVINQNLLILN